MSRSALKIASAMTWTMFLVYTAYIVNTNWTILRSGRSTAHSLGRGKDANKVWETALLNLLASELPVCLLKVKPP